MVRINKIKFLSLASSFIISRDKYSGIFFSLNISDEERNFFIRKTPGVNVIKCFSFVTVDEAK